MVENYTLIVDTREKENVRKILDSYGIEYSLATLSVGDYEIRTPTGTVTMERKTITDFIGSLFDGRLEDQMRRLSLTECPMLVLTGSFDEYRRYAKTTRFTADQVVGAVASLIVKYGLRCVIWMGNNTQPHAAGLALATKIMRKIAEGKIDEIPPRKLKPRDQSNDKEELIHLICGVPINTAKELLTTFQTVRKVLDADDESLLKVRGMGHTRIQKMRKLLGDIK